MSQTETPIDLPARSDLPTAAPLRDALIAGTGTVLLDAGDVEVLTSPVLQVLVAARDACVATERDITLTAASTAFDDCLTVLGADRSMICTIDQAGGRA